MRCSRNPASNASRACSYRRPAFASARAPEYRCVAHVPSATNAPMSPNSKNVDCPSTNAIATAPATPRAAGMSALVATVEPVRSRCGACTIGGSKVRIWRGERTNGVRHGFVADACCATTWRSLPATSAPLSWPASLTARSSSKLDPISMHCPAATGARPSTGRPSTTTHKRPASCVRLIVPLSLTSRLA